MEHSVEWITILLVSVVAFLIILAAWLFVRDGEREVSNFRDFLSIKLIYSPHIIIPETPMQNCFSIPRLADDFNMSANLLPYS